MKVFNFHKTRGKAREARLHDVTSWLGGVTVRIEAADGGRVPALLSLELTEEEARTLRHLLNRELGDR